MYLVDHGTSLSICVWPKYWSALHECRPEAGRNVQQCVMPSSDLFFAYFLIFLCMHEMHSSFFFILSVNYKYSSHIFGSNRLTMCALGICVWNAAERRAFSDIIRNRLWNSRGIVVGGGILDISHTNLGLVHDLLKFVIILRIRS